MKKAKYNEVPKEYRRNYKKETAEFLNMFALSFVIGALLIWLFTTFG